MDAFPVDIRSALQHWPHAARSRFVDIRGIVHKVALRAKVGPLIETLKWGQPSWLPEKPRTGTTLRCDWQTERPDTLSLFVHCRTTLVETIRSRHPQAFRYEGARSMHMPLDAPAPEDAIDHCAFLTLTYHRKSA